MARKKDPGKPDHAANGRPRSTGESVDGRGAAHPEQMRAEKEERRTASAAEGADKMAPAAGESLESAARPPEAAGTQKKPAPKEAFPIVGIGASAGGLQALEFFFSALPAQNGLAFVVIMHTDPEHTSLLPEILKRKSTSKILVIEDGLTIAPNTIYLPPSDRDPFIEDGVFHLKKRPGKRQLHMPVDGFLKNLAQEAGERAGCVILSGTGTDGTQGLRLIKEKSGVTVAQSRESALHGGMPESAIETGLVDYVLSPAEMPDRLIEFFKHPASLEPNPEQKQKTKADYLRRILVFLANRTRHDFSQYKESTLVRRIERRMTVTRSRNVEEYLDFLNRNPAESRSLFQDLLIGVTSFFRDPEAFSYLKERVLPEVVAGGRRSDPFRVWAPGCATGEEAFSVAIILKELLEEKNVARQLLIFGTDIDVQAIEKARQGVYPQNIAADVGPARLRRFFSNEHDHYRVTREIRDVVVFAEQNILRDPPFSTLDLLVCRNLLIYLKTEAQNRLFPLFHYTLDEGGILFLGTSESVSRHPELFNTINKTFSIYRKKNGGVRPPVEFRSWAREFRAADDNSGLAGHRRGAADKPGVAQAVEKELMKAYTPACVVVNQGGEILHIHGRTGNYLEPAPGRPNMQIADMAREGLRFALMTALRQAAEQNRDVRERGLRVKTDGEDRIVDLTVRRMENPPLKGCMMVVFEEPPATMSKNDHRNPPPRRNANRPRNLEMEQELVRVRQDYRSAMEELETSNEELRSVNEEMHSSNEELQSTNEELESSREELQSLNEELNTVNSELHGKIGELKEAHAAITSVLNSTRIAIVFLDNELRVKRFTEETARLVNLIDSDIGRPIGHISFNLEYENFPRKIQQVLQDLTTIEDDVRTRDGYWYRMRIMAHRTAEHAIEGVVLTFVNIDEQHAAQEHVKRLSAQAVAAARRYADSIIDTVRESLLVLDGKMTILTANRSFCETFGYASGEAVGKKLFELGERAWDVDPLHHVLEEIARNGKSFENYRLEHRFAGIGHKKLLLNGRLLREASDSEGKILLAIEDVSQQ